MPRKQVEGGSGFDFEKRNRLARIGAFATLEGRVQLGVIDKNAAADTADSAQPMIQLIMFPLFFISGIWIPLSELPTWLSTIARIFPVEHVADLIHRAYVGAVPFGPVLVDVAVLLGWAVLGAVVAARRFVWLPPRRG